MKSIYFKNLKFKDRKIMHYTLLVCIILLQLIVVIIWYNETANENKITDAFGQINQANEVTKFTGKVNNSIIKSQEYFNTYLSTKDPKTLNNYINSLKETSAYIDSLHIKTKKQEAFQNLLNQRDKTAKDILKIKTAIDSIIDKQAFPQHNEVIAPFEFDRFKYNKILDSIKTNTYIKVDSISKKGLLSRLIAAFSGKIEIQKEQLNTIITMKYKDKVKTGTLEEQLQHLFQMTNKYYENEFKKLKTAFLNLRKKDIQLIQFNNQLLLMSQTTLPEFNDAANDLKFDSQQNLQDQFKTNKAIRNYTIVALILLMFVISIILFGFTGLAFEYEKRLTTAQEKISKNLQFKNRIMGMISHEIRSPLNIISIYSEKIGASVKDESVKENFKSIAFTTNSLLLLSNQILEYSKAEQHQLVLKNKNFYLKNELNQILSAMGSLVESKGNKLVVSSNLDSDFEVYSDAAKIHQLFYNIIGNANKFTDNGTIKVDLQQENTSDYEVNLKVVIKDNGHGIAANDLAHIFESYYQGTISEKVNDLGVGLGLNLCKEIIEHFDGEINIQSEVKKGTQVSFNIILSKV